VIKRLGIFFGFAFMLGGALGFVPGVINDGMYFGIFMVNTPHNILHIISGAIFLITSMFGAAAVRLWFQIFGIACAALAVTGLWVGEGTIFIISNNLYDAWGHAGLALSMLLIGFVMPKETAAARQFDHDSRSKAMNS
jgi:Domain of unknown function (DUF4383)